MALTLAQAKELSQDKLTNFVIDEFRKSALLDMLTFDNTVKPQGGSSLAYVYNRVRTLPTAAVRAINSEYISQEADTDQITVNLKVFGGSYEIDRVLAKHETQVIDLIKFQSQQKAQAAVALFHDLFINGDEGGNELEFDGIDQAVTGSSTELSPNSAINLSSSNDIDSNWKVFLDNMRRLRARMDGAPSVWLMNADMFAVFQSVMDRAGINLASKDNYGNEVLQWGKSLIVALGDKPGSSDPIIPTSASGETSIYTVRLGLDGVHAVSPDGNKIVDNILPNLAGPGAVKKGEVEMVAAAVVKATRSVGVLRKIKIA